MKFLLVSYIFTGTVNRNRAPNLKKNIQSQRYENSVASSQILVMKCHTLYCVASGLTKENMSLQCII